MQYRSNPINPHQRIEIDRRREPLMGASEFPCKLSMDMMSSTLARHQILAVLHINMRCFS